MEIRQLHYFVAVAEELHFGRAAERLHMSQPPLSQQIMKFEAELGVRLFTRTRRSVSLTPAAHVLLEEARAILQALDRARQRVQAVTTGGCGRLHLGYIGPALDTPLAAIIREFKRTYPDVRLDLAEMSTNSQLDAVRKGHLDAGVVRLFRHDTSGLECLPFHRESYALALPDGHRLTAGAHVHLAELADEDFIFFPRAAQPHLYDEWMTIFARHSYSPRIVQETGTKAAALSLVAAGIGLSIVPESMAHRTPRGVAFRALTGSLPALEFQAVYRRDGVHAARNNFMTILRNAPAPFRTRP